MTTATLSDTERTSKTTPDGWRMVKFGDVVRHVKVNVDPETSGLDRYVAGEHMDTDDLHIRRWGTVGDGYLGPAFHRKFVQGQVLYGSRRTYLRKVAVAEFEGICANTTFVLEPASDELLPEFLPFVMQTEAFHEHSIKQSKGSVNPYINFSDIAWYEFALPPLNEQRRIAEVMWAADEATDAFKSVSIDLQALYNATVREMVDSSKHISKELEQAAPGVGFVALEEILLEVQYGTSNPSGLHIPGSAPILRIPNVAKGRLDLTDLNWIVLSPQDQERFAVCAGDILLVRTNGNPEYVGRSVVAQDIPENTVYASYLIRLRVDEVRARPTYVNALLNSAWLRPSLRQEIRSSAGNYNINTKGIKKQRIPLPSLDYQDRFLSRLQDIEQQMEGLVSHTERLNNLKKHLLMNLLDPQILGVKNV